MANRLKRATLPTAGRWVALLMLALSLVSVLGGCAASDSAQEATNNAATSQAGQGEQTDNQAATEQMPSQSMSEDAEELSESESVVEGAGMSEMVLVLDGQTFALELAHNEAAQAFAALAPLELTMRDVNGNEKFATLDQALPASDSAPGFIEAGDVMLYGGDGVVVFYESFSSSYRYTRLGHLSDSAAIAALSNANSIQVSFQSA